MKLHHVGIICQDIEKEKLELKKSLTVLSELGNIFDEGQNATVCLLKTAEGPDIELISGKQVENSVKKGITLYHLCYEVKNIDEQIKQLQASGGLLISSPKPAKLFNMQRVAFLFFSYGIIELLEQEK